MSNNWFEIRNAVNDVTEIFVYDQIGEDFFGEGVTAKNFIEELGKVSSKNIHLHINSPGGSVFDGIAIANALERHPATVTSYIDGLAASIATIIALAGEKVVMSGNSLFMVHNPSVMAGGTAEDLRKHADLLDKVRDTLVNTYQAKTGMATEDLVAVLDAETWYSADEAYAAGFVDEITEPIRMAAKFDLSKLPFNHVPDSLIESDEQAVINEIVKPAEAPQITPTPKESESELENFELEVASVKDEVAELRRTVEANAQVVAPVVATVPYRNAGEYAKALVAREDAAIALFRSATNAATTSADTVALPGWLGQINDLIANNRPALNSFSKAALPASGMTVEYAHVSANTLAVGVQDPENEALSFGNIAIDTVSAPVVTYGGYTSYSKQVVERSTVNFVDTAIRALAIQYAKATNAAVVAKLAGLDFTGKVFDADGGTAASLIEGIAGGAAYINGATGLAPEFILCNANSYVALMKIVGSDGRPVVNVDGAGVNNIGSASVPGLRGQLLGLPVIVDAQIADGVVYLANSAALQTLESAGAPVRLQDGDITTLTDSLSVYGYIATTVPFEGAVVKLDITA